MSSPNSRYTVSNSRLSLGERLRAIRENVNRSSREQLWLARQIASTPSPLGPVGNKQHHDMHYTAVMSQCRGDDLLMSDETLSALEARAEGDLSTHEARLGLLKDLNEVVQSMYPSRAPLRGPNTARGNDGREESLEIRPWNPKEEYDEEDDDDEEEDDDEWDGGYWVHEDETMSDYDDEEEPEDEDGEGEADETYPNGFEGHGGHGQDLDDSILGRRLGTPPTNDREGTAILIRQSQQRPHTSRENDTGYLLQIGLPVQAGPSAITRIIRVPTRMTFEQLSKSITTVFDWPHRHGYGFRLCKPCRKRIRCMCDRCEPIVARFNHVINGRAFVDDWEKQFFTNFDADKVTLSDVWGHEACRGMSMWYEYDYGENWQHSIHFVGEENADLGPAMAIPQDQEVWCLSGEGHPWPEDLPEDCVYWKTHTNLYACNREAVNKELRKLNI